MQKKLPVFKSTLGTGKGLVVTSCQICSSPKLKPIIFLGYLPPVNLMPTVGTRPQEQASYPAQLLICAHCQLVQLGLIVDPQILFPKEYPYTSGTTKILRDNFANLAAECQELVQFKPQDLVMDIGSNDGTLLSNFKPFCRVLGITPENIGKLAVEKGIPTLQTYFDGRVVDQVLQKYGKARIITATNVFAHIENIHEVLKNIHRILAGDGIFISESHYLLSLVKTLQYDTIYHEHLRYYSLTSLKYLFDMHGLAIIHAKRIPTHGGSIRVYATRSKAYRVRHSVKYILEREKVFHSNPNRWDEFRKRVVASKLTLMHLLWKLKKHGATIYGISAPSRATTLINYVGLDDGIVDVVVEVKDSYKIGKYVPGTLIPVVEESALFKNQPEYALILSWHIAKELMPKLRGGGYRGKFIIPLPTYSCIS